MPRHLIHIFGASAIKGHLKYLAAVVIEIVSYDLKSVAQGLIGAHVRIEFAPLCGEGWLERGIFEPKGAKVEDVPFTEGESERRQF